MKNSRKYFWHLTITGQQYGHLRFPMSSTRKRKLTPELKPQADVKREKISLKFSKLWRKSRFSGRKDIPNHLTALLSFCAKSEATVRLFLLILLASVSDLAISFLPGLPILQLGNQPAVPRLVDVLLSALQGPPIWGGNNWFVSRPWVLTAKIGTFHSTPSLDLRSYLGGKAEVDGRKVRLWLPYIRSAYAIAPNMPHAVWTQVISASPLAIPILTGQTPKAEQRPVVNLGDLPCCEEEDLELAERPILWALFKFQRHLRKKPSRHQKLAHVASTFLPPSGACSYQQAEVWCLAYALATFQKFLAFSVSRDWLADEDAQAIFDRFRNAVFPSLPGTSEENSAAVQIDYASRFWDFLEAFLSSSCGLVGPGEERTQATRAAITSIGQDFFLVLPRESALNEFRVWLDHHGIAWPSYGKTWAAKVQQDLMNAGVPLKTEKNDISFRYAFFAKGMAPEGSKEKLYCLAIPLPQLPDTLKELLHQRFGSNWASWCPTGDPLPGGEA